MNDLEVKVFPAQQVKNKNLGFGSVRVGGIVARFSLWQNPKFSQGFSVSFPYRKGLDDKPVNEVYFIDKELEQQVYDIIKPQIAHLLNGTGSPSPEYQQRNAAANRTAPTPNTIQRQDGNSGIPSDVPW